MPLWNFNMGVNGKILKCAISWKQLIVEQNGRKFGTHGTTVHICRVLLMPDSLSLVWGHSVHFTNFMIFKSLLLSQFSSDFTKLIVWWLWGNIGFDIFWQSAKKYHSLYAQISIRHFEIFVNTGPYLGGNFKTLLLLHFVSDLSQTLWSIRQS